MVIRLTGSLRMPMSDTVAAYLFFQPPRCPGAPPVERGEGPNSGPDWRESLGWTILLRSPNGFSGSARLARKGSDSGPCISSRWGLWTFELLEAAPVREEEEPPRFF